MAKPAAIVVKLRLGVLAGIPQLPWRLPVAVGRKEVVIIPQSSRILPVSTLSTKSVRANTLK
ncbi:hypothetical protein [Marinomonas sp.]|uniref:hypothetical protein n=1 Tax=Marinomonas sp. TaxID=1904862 RepID=UPI003A93A51D